MKRIILLFALIGLCMPCFAQQLTLTTFCKTSIQSGYPDEYGRAPKVKLYDLKVQSKIEKTLVSLGFTRKAKKSQKEFDDCSGEYYTHVTWTYAKSTSAGTTTVKSDGGGSYAITFPSADAAQKFMSTVKAAGFKYNEFREGMYAMPGNDKVYWAGVGISISGKTVKIEAFAAA